MSGDGAVKGCACFRLRRTTRAITRLYDTYLLPAGVTVTQYSLLAKLSAAGPVTMRALADIMGMDRTSLTRTLAPLQAQGLVAIAPGADRRSRAIRLTEAGDALRQRCRPIWRAAQEDLQRRLGGDTLDRLQALLDQAFARLQEDAPG
jgi:DNA-binding MarR family transcriptional regulator